MLPLVDVDVSLGARKVLKGESLRTDEGEDPPGGSREQRGGWDAISRGSAALDHWIS